MYVLPLDRVGLASDGWWRRCCYGCHGCCGTLSGPFKTYKEAMEFKGITGKVRDPWEVKWPKPRRYRPSNVHSD